MANDEQKVNEPAAGAAASTSTGDSPAVPTQAAPEAKTPRVPKAGDSFPWEFRDTEEVEVPAKGQDGTETLERKAKDRVTKCVATITSVSRDLVWCDLVPDPSIEAKELVRIQRVIGFPRHVHVMMADAKKALKLPA